MMSWETEFIPNKKFMELALDLAKQAGENGEVPVGAVVEKNGEVIAVGLNCCEKTKNPLNHAEMIAIKSACEKLDTWRLSDCNIYVSLEPCAMCTGAIINSRIKRVIFAAHEEKMGCCGGLFDLTKEMIVHKPKIFRGFMESESKVIIKSFFENIRKIKA